MKTNIVEVFCFGSIFSFPRLLSLLPSVWFCKSFFNITQIKEVFSRLEIVNISIESSSIAEVFLHMNLVSGIFIQTLLL